MKTKPMCEWTVMIYMAADEANIDPESIRDIKEMKTIGSTKDVNVLVQVDRSNDETTKRYYVTSTRRLSEDVEQELGEVNTGDPNNLVEFIRWGQRYCPARHYLVILWGHGAGVLDADYMTFSPPPPSILGKSKGKRWSNRMGSARKLARQMQEFSPATLLPQHYQLYQRTLFLPSKLSLLARDKRAKLIALDYPQGEQLDYLDNRELKWAMAQAQTILKQPIDVLGMDACLMSMAEIAYQLRDDVCYLVGSQDLVTLEGFPYGRILRLLTTVPKTTPRELAKKMVEYYINAPPAKPARKGELKFRTLSACDLAKLSSAEKDSMIHAIDALAQTMLKLSNNKKTDAEVADLVRQIILEARGRSQYYDEGDYIDLHHFCALLIARGTAMVEKAKRKLPGIKKRKSKAEYAERQAFVQALENACDLITKASERIHRLFGPKSFVMTEGHRGRLVGQSKGLSIYFPFKRVDPTYKADIVNFVSDTSWLQFVRVFIRQTQWLRFIEEFASNPRTRFRIKVE